MAHATLTIQVKVAWWVAPYLRLVALCLRLTGRGPDLQAVHDTCMRGIKVVR